MIFMIDLNIPTSLSTKDLKKIVSNNRVIYLSKKSKYLTKMIGNNISYVTQFLHNYLLMIKKIKIDTSLVCKKLKL